MICNYCGDRIKTDETYYHAPTYDLNFHTDCVGKDEVYGDKMTIRIEKRIKEDSTMNRYLIISDEKIDGEMHTHFDIIAEVGFTQAIEKVLNARPNVIRTVYLTYGEISSINRAMAFKTDSELEKKFEENIRTKA